MPCPIPIEKAVLVLQRGGVVAFPTETFYGLAVDPNQQEALNRLDQLKGALRDHKPYPLIIANQTHLARLVATLPAQAALLIEQFWPGPLTLVLPGRQGLDARIVGPTGGVALRISSHPLANQLAQAFDGPLTATSANPAGMPPVCVAQDVQAYFADRVELLLDGGRCPGGQPSTLLDLTTTPFQILREGAIPITQLRPFFAVNTPDEEIGV